MRRLVLVVLLLALVAGVAVWQVPRLLSGDDTGDRAAADAFAAAWPAGTLGALPWDAASGPDPAGQVAALTAGLTPADADLPSGVRVLAVTRDESDDDLAVADLEVAWQAPAPWTYATRLELLRTDDEWRPVLTAAVVHPSLAAGTVLRSRAERPPRAAVVDRVGEPIVTERSVVTVGLEPRRSTDLTATVTQVAALVEVDAAALQARAAAAAPTAFVDVITLRRAAYDEVRDRLRPIPGVVFREGVRQLAPTTAFARALLGSVGPATAEVVEQSGGRIRPDEEVGLSGLQERFQDQLGGTAGVTVEVVPAAPAAEGAVAAAPVALLTVPPVPGTPLQLTLDQRVQQAADDALAGQTARVALVAVQPSTGDVLAVANNGPDGPGVDRALTGRYPPGSTFKIASGLALLRSGLVPTDVVDCPATLRVSGKEFANAEDEVLGPVPFATDFALSCNTAFIGSAGRVDGAALKTAADDLGYGTYDLGVGAFGADVPGSDEAVEHAAEMIGQGRVLASPLAVAVSAATVASGALHPPRLLSSAPAAAAGPALPEAPALQALTRGVVTSGTGRALAAVPGGPVGGKTGTAEFGTEVPPRTHAWFAGFQGDLAFAVIVEDGGFGGAVAAPLAAAFLTALAA